MITTGAVVMPLSQLSGSSPGAVVTSQNRSTSSRRSSTRNAQPWLKPAVGARMALDNARSTTARSTGLSAYSRIMRRRRTTSWNSMGVSVPDHFEQMWRTLEPLGRSDGSGGYFRQPFEPAERELDAWFVEQASARSLRLQSDAFGNRIAWWDAGSGPGVVTGSHLDSVLDGGAYDGPLGVVSALAAGDVLRERGVRPARPIGVSVFVEEEGSRFGLACLGSRLATGTVAWDGARALRDRNGVRLDEAMTELGLAGANPQPWLTSEHIGCFVELHVEQGRDLVDRGVPIGVAGRIWPHGRYRFEFSGSANHAGTTRMEDRQDPMLTYAMTALAANKQARVAGQRATFGRLDK